MYKKTIQMWITVMLAVVSFASMLHVPVTATGSSAGGAVLYEPQSGRVLYEHQAHLKRPMASTTKLMTALVAAETLPPEHRITVTDEALRVEGTSMGLQSGDVLTAEDLLKGLLLASGNDAANVLALAVSGSLEAFAVRMNERAETIGMRHTRFVTPSGLDADGHGSTPYDMALLAAEVLKNERLASVCAMRSATVSIGDRTVTLTNHNKLLASYEGAVGMKTGFTKAAGRCLVSAAKRDGVTLIAVTLNCSDDWQVHTDLLDSGFSLTESVLLPKPDVPSVPVFGGQCRQVAVTTDPQTATILKTNASSLSAKVEVPAYIWAPIGQGQTVGEVRYYIGSDCVASVPVYTTQAVDACAPATTGQRFVALLAALLRQVLVG